MTQIDMAWRCRDHMLWIHHNTKPYPCPVCVHTGFSSKQRLCEHIRYAHRRNRNAILRQVSQERFFDYPFPPLVVVSYGQPLAGSTQSQVMMSASKTTPQITDSGNGIEEAVEPPHDPYLDYVFEQNNPDTRMKAGSGEIASSIEQHSVEAPIPIDHWDRDFGALLQSANEQMEVEHAARGQQWSVLDRRWTRVLSTSSVPPNHI